MQMNVTKKTGRLAPRKINEGASRIKSNSDDDGRVSSDRFLLLSNL